jgi:hypothetical protein
VRGACDAGGARDLLEISSDISIDGGHLQNGDSRH